MAVYTQLGAEALGQLIDAFDVGALVSAKGIAEGVSNSNWLIDTCGPAGSDFTAGNRRFILTMFEGRTEVADLPFFLGLLDHLAEAEAARGVCPVPRTIHDRNGASYRFVEGEDGTRKAVALIEFLPGVSLSTPTPAQAHAVGRALAGLHLAAADFAQARPNGMGLASWHDLLGACGEAGLARIDASLPALVARELPLLAARWPTDLPSGTIHADLFPDNVLMLGDKVTGLIDFYFACTDLLAYDLAVTHAAWCFSADGRQFDAAISAALLAGYGELRAISPAERAALPLLARGAAMRFLATRAYDWINTPQDALVVKKDPMAFAARVEFYANPANAGVFAA
jgi:homoserine kinase type II